MTRSDPCVVVFTQQQLPKPELKIREQQHRKVGLVLQVSTQCTCEIEIIRETVPNFECRIPHGCKGIWVKQFEDDWD